MNLFASQRRLGSHKSWVRQSGAPDPQSAEDWHARAEVAVLDRARSTWQALAAKRNRNAQLRALCNMSQWHTLRTNVMARRLSQLIQTVHDQRQAGSPGRRTLQADESGPSSQAQVHGGTGLAQGECGEQGSARGACECMARQPRPHDVRVGEHERQRRRRHIPRSRTRATHAHVHRSLPKRRQGGRTFRAPPPPCHQPAQGPASASGKVVDGHQEEDVADRQAGNVRGCEQAWRGLRARHRKRQALGHVRK